jgi:hypothetical protein
LCNKEESKQLARVLFGAAALSSIPSSVHRVKSFGLIARDEEELKAQSAALETLTALRSAVGRSGGGRSASIDALSPRGHCRNASMEALMMQEGNAPSKPAHQA